MPRLRLQHDALVIAMTSYLAVGWCIPVMAQVTNETATERAAPLSFVTPPAPVLRPDEELATIQLADGFRLELVASDPIVQDPVAMTFDPDGRIWVCEMQGFMPDVDGTDQDAPVGAITLIEDTDHDGIMDRRTVFADGFVMPRGLCWTLDGLLVCENGHLWLCEDHDHDDRCDAKRLVCTYNSGNPEHALNGLMPALDNWIYNAHEGIRLRRVGESWTESSFFARGQWGITQDNHGYLYYNVNASLLRGDLVPCYSPIAQVGNPWVDTQLYEDATMFPIRPTPGINRGYVSGFLRPDGSLIEANANCGPVVYRGDNLPPELVGDVFICEPAGNLIRRQRIANGSKVKTSYNAYEQKEFLASVDERFRPVNMYNAPDGTLYIVDMYRGIIQYGAFLTPYLRQQIVARRLDQGIHLGRIFRVVHHTTQARPTIRLGQLNSHQLVDYLASQNGWHRDMAQQLIVQRGDHAVSDALEQLATTSDDPLARLHALWTLEGLGHVDLELLEELLGDNDPHVRASAVTIYQKLLVYDTVRMTVVDDFAEVTHDEHPLVQSQVALALGLLETEEADTALEPILRIAAEDDFQLTGLLSGFAGQETDFMAARLSHDTWTHEANWRKRVLETAAKVMWWRRDPIETQRFCELLSERSRAPNWQLLALLSGIQDPPVPQPIRRFPPPPRATQDEASEPPATPRDPAVRPASKGPPLYRRGREFYFPGPRRAKMRLNVQPAALETLRGSPDPQIAAAAEAFADRLVWPGKDGNPLPEKPSLTEQQRELYDIGQREFAALCASCHGPLGYGLTAKGPPLVGSQWLANEQRLIRILMHGLEGPISLNGGLFNIDNRLSMPGMQKLFDDEKIAGILTYVRREFLDDGGPVDPQAVAKIRHGSTRKEPWTEAELKASAP